MLKPKHPGFCLATRLYLETNTIFLCFGVFSRRYIREVLPECWGYLSLCSNEIKGRVPPPPIENLFSYVPCSPILPLFLSSPQKLAFLSLFA